MIFNLSVDLRKRLRKTDRHVRRSKFIWKWLPRSMVVLLIFQLLCYGDNAVAGRIFGMCLEYGLFFLTVGYYYFHLRAKKMALARLKSIEPSIAEVYKTIELMEEQEAMMRRLISGKVFEDAFVVVEQETKQKTVH